MIHDNNDFLNFTKNKIIQVQSVMPSNNYVKAIITTKQYGRVSTRPYEIKNSEWLDTILRGWIE